MKKNYSTILHKLMPLLFFLALLFVPLSIIGQTTINCQDFESNDNFWDEEDGSISGVTIATGDSFKIDKEDKVESDDYDFSPFTSVTLTLTYQSQGFESGEEIRVRFRDNGNWVTLATYDEGDEFSNNTSETVSFTVLATDYDFEDGSNDKFRIYNDANGGDDELYIDDICIVGVLPPTVTIDCQDFESNSDGWDEEDGGTTGTTIATGDSFKIDKEDKAESEEYDFSLYASVTLTFTYQSQGFEAGEEIRVAFRDNGSWVTIVTYDRGDEFNNNTSETVSLTVLATDYDFEDGSNDKFRIYNDANGGDDDLYIDDICIIGNTSVTGPEIDVLGNSVSIADGDNNPSTTDHTDFGSVSFSSGTVVRTFTITNSGTEDVILSGTPKVSISGADAVHFSLSSVPTSPVTDSGGTTTFEVTFDPSAPGDFSATLTIESDDADEGTYDFAISGVGAFSNGIEVDCQDFQSNDDGWDQSGNPGQRDATNISGSSHSYWMDRKEFAESDQYDFNDYGAVTLEFTFQTEEFDDGDTDEDGDDYEIDFNDGSGWVTISRVLIDGNWTDGDVVTVSVTIYGSDYNFKDGANDQFRIKNDADGSNDEMYIDDVCITGYEYCFEDVICAGTTTIWNGAAWSNGAPTSSTPATIQGNYDTAIGGDFTACTLTVVSPYTLIIDDGGLVEVQSDITNNGIIAIDNNGSLVQYYDSATNSGSGSLNVTRVSNTMYQYDYTYWGAPVSGYNLSNINQDRAYSYENGDWSEASGIMTPGKGYIVMTDNASNDTATVTTVTFAGAIVNGTVNAAVDVATGDWNLLGNPYPSAIDADDFLSNATNEGLINGTVYLWNHATRIDDYENGRGQFTSNDYASYNLIGGTAAISGGVVPTGKIATGQGFFVETIGTGSVVFNNCMRSFTAGDNSQFYRSTESSQNNSKEYNRYWLDFVNESGDSKQLLIGYDNNATLGFDRLYDGTVLEGDNKVSFYSFAETAKREKLTIQGRPIPDTKEVVIPIGFEIKEGASSNNIISLSNHDGVFTDLNVYLFDKLEGSTHDLRDGGYEFESEVGVYDDRFELRYTNTMEKEIIKEEVQEVTGVDSGVIMMSKENSIYISSKDKIIVDVKMYDTLGKVIYHASSLEVENMEINSINPEKKLRIFSLVFEDGTTDTRKVIH